MNKALLIVAILVLFAVSPVVAFVASAQTQTGGGNTGAQTQPGGGNTSPTSVTLMNPLQGGGTLEGFLNDILSFVIRIGAIVVVLMLVLVGYKFVAARGSPKEIEDARRMLLYTIIGALILLGAQAISLGIQATVQALSSGIGS